jgi:hypothetical protein
MYRCLSKFNFAPWSPRLAANPLNAMLNYLYALLESEARLVVAALGLDPGLGVMHMDMPTRDSLACDVMEAVRPMVDAYLLKWVSRETLRRDWAPFPLWARCQAAIVDDLAILKSSHSAVHQVQAAANAQRHAGDFPRELVSQGRAGALSGLGSARICAN